jgi:hypothetical protein
VRFAKMRSTLTKTALSTSSSKALITASSALQLTIAQVTLLTVMPHSLLMDNNTHAIALLMSAITLWLNLVPPFAVKKPILIKIAPTCSLLMALTTAITILPTITALVKLTSVMLPSAFQDLNTHAIATLMKVPNAWHMSNNLAVRFAKILNKNKKIAQHISCLMALTTATSPKPITTALVTSPNAMLDSQSTENIKNAIALQMNAMT